MKNFIYPSSTHLSKATFLLISLTFYKDLSALGGREETFLKAVFAILLYQQLHFPLAMPLRDGQCINLICCIR